ncbi:hypothetical protein D1007_32104 [Hordeum vulgare]|nr:hypothetical protein D1007_32104 [Hordeum vulgare]
MGQIGVAVPSTLSRLTRPQQLYLEGNALAGGVPGKVLSRMSSLRYLSLAGNRLEGTLPPELGDVRGLVRGAPCRFRGLMTRTFSLLLHCSFVMLCTAVERNPGEKCRNWASRT